MATAKRSDPGVRCARRADRDVALRGTVRAFETDPLLRWLWSDDERYAECAPAFFGLMLDLRLAGGAVWVDDAGLGASSSWNPPGGIAVAQSEQDRRWAEVGEGWRPDEVRRLQALGDALDPLQPAQPTWYLGVLAVDPPHQGRGLGSAVVRTGLAEVDAAGTTAYLETMMPRNVVLYERLGFQVTHQVDLPLSGPRGWVMMRPAG